MMLEHMNVEEYQTSGSTPLMFIVSFPYASVVCYLSIIFVTPHHYYKLLFRDINLPYD